MPAVTLAMRALLVTQTRVVDGEQYDGSTDVLKKVELDNDNFEMAEGLLLVVLGKHQRNSGKKSAMIDVDNVEETVRLSGIELPEVSLTLMDVLPPTSLVGVSATQHTFPNPPCSYQKEALL
ncbi:hypothetical protein EV421DRAFT_1740591 [Armillaria borealis]|uniref:Uncharacterized protein n=1 Tax=Armillaria borealis TaxID=47425 RepID=A0AA39MII1_9AGAR|nr:hypothetical protein EV421DRAFT_1740591 [Armillaria borealis]